VAKQTIDALVREFFECFSARVKKRAEVLEIDLRDPEKLGEVQKRNLAALRERFRADQLSLVFDREHLEAGRELVALGGHLLRQIELHMDGLGQHCYVLDDARHRLTRAEARNALDIRGAHSIAALDRSPRPAWDLYFGYKVVLRGHESEERFETLRVELRPDGVGPARLSEPPPGLKKRAWKPRKRAPGPGQHQAEKSARSELERRAVDWALELRGRSQARIVKDVRRLRDFYETQIIELRGNRTPSDQARDRIIALEEEQERKVQELIRATKVEIDCELVQLLVVERTLQDVALRVVAGPRDATIALTYDRANAELSVPTCDGCAGQLAPLALCSQSHAQCVRCLHACSCGADLCRRCAPRACAQCERSVCASCLQECAGCHEATCSEHRSACQRCEEPSCNACVARCERCQASCCERCSMGRDASGRSLCQGCGALCSGCQTAAPSDELAACALCGRRFCTGCLAASPECESCRPLD
jgi:hypothetical protein